MPTRRAKSEVENNSLGDTNPMNVRRHEADRISIAALLNSTFKIEVRSNHIGATDLNEKTQRALCAT